MKCYYRVWIDIPDKEEESGYNHLSWHTLLDHAEAEVTRQNLATGVDRGDFADGGLVYVHTQTYCETQNRILNLLSDD